MLEKDYTSTAYLGLRRLYMRILRVHSIAEVELPLELWRIIIQFPPMATYLPICLRKFVCNSRGWRSAYARGRGRMGGSHIGDNNLSYDADFYFESQLCLHWKGTPVVISTHWKSVWPDIMKSIVRRYDWRGFLPLPMIAQWWGRDSKTQAWTSQKWNCGFFAPQWGVRI